MEIYLDTNAINYLFEREGYTPHVLDEIRTRLRNAVCSGSLIVMADTTLLEELAGTAYRNNAKYQRMFDYIHGLIGSNWLLPLNERVKCEANLKRPLKDQERMLVSSPTNDLSTVLEVSDDSYERKKKFKQDHDASRSTLIDQFGRAPLMANAKAWWAEAERIIPGWVIDYFEASQDILDLPKDRSQWPLPKEVPSAWNFITYYLARLWMNLGKGSRIVPSDENDARHYSAAAYANVMVTDDAAFIETYAEIPNTPFKLERFSDFVKTLKS